MNKRNDLGDTFGQQLKTFTTRERLPPCDNQTETNYRIKNRLWNHGTHGTHGIQNLRKLGSLSVCSVFSVVKKNESRTDYGTTECTEHTEFRT